MVAEHALNQITPDGAGQPASQPADGAQGAEGLPPDALQDLIKEAEALAGYLAGRGDLLAKQPTDGSGPALLARLVEALAGARDATDVKAAAELYSAYAAITAVTYAACELNGRSVIDTRATTEGARRKWLAQRQNRPIEIGIVLFLLVLGADLLLESMSAQGAGQVGPKPAGVTLLTSLVIPALWGGIGTCVFLAKKLSDKLYNMAFEVGRLRGDRTRIFLGAMFGVIVVDLFYTSGGGGTLSQAGFSPASAAFIAGLGIKPVYATYEALTERLATLIAPPK